MNQTIEQISAETIALIESQAKIAGLSVDDYLQSLIPQTNGHEESRKNTISHEERMRHLKEWLERPHSSAPALSLEDISRETIY